MEQEPRNENQNLKLQLTLILVGLRDAIESGRPENLEKAKEKLDKLEELIGELK